MNLHKFHISPIAMALTILLVFFVYNILGVNAIFILGCLLLFGWCMIGNIDAVFLSLILLTPNIMMIKHLSNSSAILGYAFFVFEWRVLLGNMAQHNRFYVPKESLMFLGTSIATFILTASFPYLSSAVRVLSFSFFIYVFFTLGNRKTKEYYDRFVYLYCIGITCTVLLGIAYWIVLGQDIFVGYFSGIRNDRNYFSATLSVGIAVSALYYTSTKDMKSARKYLIPMMIMVIGGILSNSRTFMASLIISFAIIAKNTLSIRKIKRMLPMIVFISICIVLISKNEKIVVAITDTMVRFSDNTMEDGNGRFDTWRIYLSDYCSSVGSILLGKGSEIAILPKMSAFMATHNTYIQGLYCGGILGFASYISIFYGIFLEFSGKHKVKLIQFFPMIALLLCRFFVASYMSDAFSYEMLLTIIISVYSISEVKNADRTDQHHLRNW